MNVPSVSTGAEYDDRVFPQFASVRDRTRGQLLLGGVVIGIVLIIAGVGLSQRPLNLHSVRDIGIVILICVFGFLGVLLIALVPMPRHYVIRDGLLEYPRWGGLRRGRILLRDLQAYNVEGRDEASAAIVLWSRRGRALTLPQGLLASPNLFRKALASAGLLERPPRFRR